MHTSIICMRHEQSMYEGVRTKKKQPIGFSSLDKRSIGKRRKYTIFNAKRTTKPSFFYFNFHTEQFGIVFAIIVT